MSYISTDFDNLNAGINILNIAETDSDLLQYEGTYSDKGLGYKQQYALIGASNISSNISHLYIDFCFIFKDGFTTQNVTNLNSMGYPLTITPTITSDSDGNVVWLYENVDTWGGLPYFWDGTLSYLRWYVGNTEYFYYIRSDTEIDGKQPDEFDVVAYEVTSANITFEAERYSSTSSTLQITFNGTFYNGSLGLFNNSIQEISIYHFDSNDEPVIDKTLVSGTDYTISGNRVYSGTGTEARPISVNTGILYNESKPIYMVFKTIAKDDFRAYLIPKGIPVANWKAGEFQVNGGLFVADTDGQNRKNVLVDGGKQYVTFNGQDNIQSTDEQTVVSTTLDKGLYLLNCNFVINYYGQTGRELNTKLYLNNQLINYTTGVINTYAWALTRTIVAFIQVDNDNSTLTLKTESTTTARYDYGSSGLEILRIR